MISRSNIKSLTKLEIANNIAKKCNINNKLALNIVDSALKQIAFLLKNSGQLQLTNFGKFTVKQKKLRYGRNPKTKQQAVITARKVISFKTNKALLNKINNNLIGAISSVQE
jgi:integration host factor subunit alpha